MEIKSAESVQAKPVEMDGVAGVNMRMLIGPDQDAPHFNMRMFDVAPDGHTPLHSHGWEHEVYVVAGEGMVRGDGEDRPIAAGDCAYIPPEELHQFANTGARPLRFLCLVPADSG